MVYYEWGFADNGAEEFLFGDLFKVGEAEFREEFLDQLVKIIYCRERKGK